MNAEQQRDRYVDWYREAEGDLECIRARVQEALNERIKMASEGEDDPTVSRYHRNVARGLGEALGIVQDVLANPGSSGP